MKLMLILKEVMTFRSLKIQIFGDGSGETIFIELPNEEVGIIDCGNSEFIDWFKSYCSSRNLQSIGFIIWTHPHDDHSKKLGDLLDFCFEHQITIKKFCRFGYVDFTPIAKQLDRKISFLKAKMLRDAPTLYVNKSRPGYFLELLNKIDALNNSGLILNLADNLTLGQSIYPPDNICEGIEFFCIAPTMEDIKYYAKKHKEAHERAMINLSPDNDFSRLFRLESDLHNRLSVAVCLKYNQKRLIFGGDVENPSWSKILSFQEYKDYASDTIIFLKVAHHGSGGSYFENIWNAWGENYNCVITPYNLSHIPRKEALECFYQHTRNINILKNKQKNTIGGDQNYLVEAFFSPNKEILPNDTSTHQIEYTITDTGLVDYGWIQSLNTIPSH